MPPSPQDTKDQMARCSGCQRSIWDRSMLHVLGRNWHTHCVRCCQCRVPLTDRCFVKEGQLYCRTDFYRRFGTKCDGCTERISPGDLIRRAGEKVFHLRCFTCFVCHRQVCTGEQLFLVPGANWKFLCEEDYFGGFYPDRKREDGHHPDSSDNTASDSQIFRSQKDIPLGSDTNPQHILSQNTLMDTATVSSLSDSHATQFKISSLPITASPTFCLGSHHQLYNKVQTRRPDRNIPELDNDCGSRHGTLTRERRRQGRRRGIRCTERGARGRGKKESDRIQERKGGRGSKSNAGADEDLSPASFTEIINWDVQNVQGLNPSRPDSVDYDYSSGKGTTCASLGLAGKESSASCTLSSADSNDNVCTAILESAEKACYVCHSQEGDDSSSPVASMDWDTITFSVLDSPIRDIVTSSNLESAERTTSSPAGSKQPSVEILTTFRGGLFNKIMQRPETIHNGCESESSYLDLDKLVAVLSLCPNSGDGVGTTTTTITTTTLANNSKNNTIYSNSLNTITPITKTNRYNIANTTPSGDNSITPNGGNITNSIPKYSIITTNTSKNIDISAAGKGTTEMTTTMMAKKKKRGPRTSIKAKQLEVLKAVFAVSPKPPRNLREHLAMETGLNMRVIQVWFQNKRSKERRMKELKSTADGRRVHFMSPSPLERTEHGQMDTFVLPRSLGFRPTGEFENGRYIYLGFPRSCNEFCNGGMADVARTFSPLAPCQTGVISDQLFTHGNASAVMHPPNYC